MDVLSDICGICRETLVENSQTLECGHAFHSPCILAWVDINPHCPFCRAEVFVFLNRVVTGNALHALIIAGRRSSTQADTRDLEEVVEGMFATRSGLSVISIESHSDSVETTGR